MKIEFDVTPAQFSALEAVGQKLRCSPADAAKVMAFMTANTDFDGLGRFFEHAEAVTNTVKSGGVFLGSQKKVGGCISVPPTRPGQVKQLEIVTAADRDRLATQHALNCWKIARDALPKGCLPCVDFGAADNAVTRVWVSANIFGRSITAGGDTFQEALQKILVEANPVNEAKRLRAMAETLEEVAS